MKDLAAAFGQLRPRRVLVVGDVMLDRYVWGHTNRVSPEAPVLVLQAESHEARLGGAGSVAAQLRALDCDVRLAGVIGDDAHGRIVRRLLAEQAIDDAGVVSDVDRPTTTKERFMGRAGSSPQQMLRVDYESRTPLTQSQEHQLLRLLADSWSWAEAIIVSDYAKGVCSSALLQKIIRRGPSMGVPVVVDPARGGDYRNYAGATALTPNRHEAAEASGVEIHTPVDAGRAARRLRVQCQADAICVTLDCDGIAIATSEEGVHLPTQSQQVCDVTGAGDTVVAMTALGMANGLTVKRAARLANVAAGLQVQRLGAMAVTRKEIESELCGGRSSRSPLSADASQLNPLVCTVEEYRRRGMTIALTNGCFDLLHAGHIRCLEEAAQLADVLIVAVNSDDSVRRLKGPSRPILCEQQRAEMLAALTCVDHVVIFDEETPHKLLGRLRPDVLVKGGGYARDEVVGREIVEAYGGEVRVTSHVDGISTSAIVKAVRPPDDVEQETVLTAR